MKKLSLLLFLFALVFSACEKDEDMYKVLPIDQVTVPVLNAHNAIVVNGDNLAEITTFKWKTADFGIPTAIEYSLHIQAASGTDSIIASTLADSLDLKMNDLNKAMIGIGLQPGVSVDAQFYISASINNTPYGSVKSAPITVNVMAYEPQPAFMYVPGQYQGWSPETASTLCSLTDNDIYIGYINFDAAGSGFKIMYVPDWGSGTDYGMNAAKTNLEQPGSDILSPGAGWYRVTANMKALTIDMKQFGNLGVVGTINNWGAPDIQMTYNSAMYRFEAVITCSDNAEIKFRLNEDWNQTNWGVDDNGEIVTGGGNIKIPVAGTYLVTFDILNESNPVYTITPKQ